MGRRIKEAKGGQGRTFYQNLINSLNQFQYQNHKILVTLKSLDEGKIKRSSKKSKKRSKQVKWDGETGVERFLGLEAKTMVAIELIK